MEDRAVCLEDLLGGREGPRVGFYGVYDGHNGGAAVDFVSRHMHGALQAALLAAPLRSVQLSAFILRQAPPSFKVTKDMLLLSKAMP